MGQQVRQTIGTWTNRQIKILLNYFYCTPDKSHQEQMLQIIRYVYISNRDIMIKESFIDLYVLTKNQD